MDNKIVCVFTGVETPVNVFIVKGGICANSDCRLKFLTIVMFFLWFRTGMVQKQESKMPTANQETTSIAEQFQQWCSQNKGTINNITRSTKVTKQQQHQHAETCFNTKQVWFFRLATAKGKPFTTRCTSNAELSEESKLPASPPSSQQHDNNSKCHTWTTTVRRFSIHEKQNHDRLVTDESYDATTLLSVFYLHLNAACGIAFAGEVSGTST